MKGLLFPLFGYQQSFLILQDIQRNNFLYGGC